MDTLKIGLVGMGHRGVAWVHTFKNVQGARVVALCDKIPALLDQGLKAAGDPEVKGHTNYDRMLEQSDLDAIGIIVEPENQCDLIARGLAAGKHVLCEVPLAFSLEECWKIVLAVERGGLKFAMAEQVSFAPFTLAWRKLVTEEKLGKVVFAEGQYLHGMGPDRLWLDKVTGRRIMRGQEKLNPNATQSRIWKLKHPIWYLPHELGPLLRILDDRVCTVTCMQTRRPSYHYEELPLPDIEVAIMHTSKDTIIREACGFCMPTAQPSHWYHLLGTRGEVETGRSGGEVLGGTGKWWLADQYMASRQEMAWQFTPYQSGAAGAEATGHGGLDFYPLQDFVDAVLNDRPTTVNVYRAADISAAGICAGLSAEKDGAPVEVPAFLPDQRRSLGQPPQ